LLVSKDTITAYDEAYHHKNTLLEHDWSV